MEYIYCNGWFRAKKKVTKLWDIKDAEKAHALRQVYHVVVTDKETPYCFIDINNNAMYVGFLDEMKREYLGYAFEEKKPGKLFLTEAIYWGYEGDTDQRKEKTKYFFTSEGSLQIHRIDSKTSEGEILTAKNPVDISANCEDYPEFGHYEKLIKKERVSLTA
jgi:hypothetical protein